VNSLVKKNYDSNGFLRKFYTGNIQDIIENIQL
jgi:hypothetical protein